MVDFTPLSSRDFAGFESPKQSDLLPTTLAQEFISAVDPAQGPSHPATHGLLEMENSFSRFGSPLPSLNFASEKPDARDLHGVSSNRPQRPYWKISKVEYRHLKDKIEPFSAASPVQFPVPSRHSLSRYLEGCSRGLFEHLPFLHAPTFSTAEAAPELILAMAAIGAQFRFETSQSLVLFYAAKSILQNQVQRRDSERIAELLCRSRARTTSSTCAALHTEHSLDTRTSLNSVSKTDRENTPELRLQTIQALIALLVMGAWGPQQLVQETISLQSLAATLVREDSVIDSQHQETEGLSEWRAWAFTESQKRAMLVVYSFNQLVSLAYHSPPLLLFSEIDCNLPVSAELWNASTEDSWRECYQIRGKEEMTFRESFESLFRDDPIRTNNVPSPLANYVLILAVLQHIFLRRQDTTISTGHKLHPTDVARTRIALKQWQRRWERSPESSVDPFSSAGPVAFNSTALLRIAWIGLYVDLGPCRDLASRNSGFIASAFKNCPSLQWGPDLIYPVLQASYALAIPVRMGLHFVAKTQTLTWSVQHSLSNLECAIFLSKWLEMMAVTCSTTSLEKGELMLIHMIHSLLEETDLFQDSVPTEMADKHDQSRKIRWLATGVARIWAKIFKGTHVFEVVNIIGASLAIYATSMENEFKQIHGDLDGWTDPILDAIGDQH